MFIVSTNYPICNSFRVEQAKTWSDGVVELTSESWRVQRQALLFASGAFISTSNSDLEILTHTMPLWMHLDEVLLHEYARICRRSSDDFLRMLICDLLGNTVHLNHRVLSPIHILKSALRQADFDDDLFQSGAFACFLFVKAEKRHPSHSLETRKRRLIKD